MAETSAASGIGTHAALALELQATLGQLRNVLERRAVDLDRRVADLSERLARARFHLAVIGQFKRGKTTCINSLLGAAVLPTGVVPLTSIVTFIAYGEEAAAVVHFHAGKTQPITLREVAAYVTERENPHNIKKVARVEVTYPAPILRDGVVLIDTPGIGSTFDHNTDVTYAFLPQVDAAVFVVSVDPPLSRAEKDFLIAVRDHAAKLFFVLNKVDYVGELERRELLEFLHRTLATELGIVEPKIFPLSAKQALEAAAAGGAAGGLPVFRAALETFLLHDKGRVALVAAAGAALRLLGEARFLIDLEHKALAMPLEELEGKLAEFDRLRAQAEQERRDLDHLLKGEQEQLIRLLDEELGALKLEMVPALVAELQTFAEAHPNLKGRNLAAEVQDELKRRLVERLERWRGAQEQRLDAELRRLSGRFVTLVNERIARIATLAAALFDLPAVPLVSVEGLNTESELYYVVGEDPVLLGIEPVYFSTLLPGRVTRRFVLADARRQVSVEVERNCGRLRYDLLCRIEGSMRRFSRQLGERTQRTLEGIRGAIEAGATMHARRTEETAARQADLTAGRSALAAVDERLRQIREDAAKL